MVNQDSFQLHCKVLDWMSGQSDGTYAWQQLPINPHHSLHTFAGTHFLLAFWPYIQKVPVYFLYHLVENCPVWFSILKQSASLLKALCSHSVVSQIDLYI